ncbi:hypothetical protein CW736_05475 [Nonlabens sp. MB-3u-79]|jgi:light-regulated signal transduction histidine kinase (bacteriophytochrome)|uniref:hypothetical protein n=1 Tax=Nonlabens sp. MB-3u-79 TaxID=2058134 RepID=UPI000C318DEC|nr:hypothetical protein [Nonlabens sp. MB-3u-79]AUC78878.1 hypothetical protein CW736_05475 [Nonlabens sp. MB-3u-79]|tara:strand:- start:37053 stop:37292 length:240 start_codon:yes stop_codon:yes gene_type:complete
MRSIKKQEIAELISHHLRTPVAKTLQNIDFLKEDSDNRQERETKLHKHLSHLFYETLIVQDHSPGSCKDATVWNVTCIN